MPSFDIVSKTDMAEVDNAIAGIEREIGTRFDFKGSNSSIERAEQEIIIVADDDLKLKQMHELLKVHMTRRKIDAAALDLSAPPRDAAQGTLRQVVTVRQGISPDVARKIVKEVKGSKMKVQVQIQGDELRVTGKKRDDLQAAISLVKGMKIDQPLQYENFRD